MEKPVFADGGGEDSFFNKVGVEVDTTVAQEYAERGCNSKA